MKKVSVLGIILAMALLFLTTGGWAQTATFTNTATATRTATATQTKTSTPNFTNTVVNTSTVTPTMTQTPANLIYHIHIYDVSPNGVTQVSLANVGAGSWVDYGSSVEASSFNLDYFPHPLFFWTRQKNNYLEINCIDDNFKKVNLSAAGRGITLTAIITR